MGESSISGKNQCLFQLMLLFRTKIKSLFELGLKIILPCLSICVLIAITLMGYGSKVNRKEMPATSSTSLFYGSVWVASGAGKIVGYNTVTQQVVGTINTPATPLGIASTSDGSTTVATLSNGSLEVITGANSSNPDTSLVYQDLPDNCNSPCTPYAVAFSPFGLGYLTNNIATNPINPTDTGQLIPFSISHNGLVTCFNPIPVGSNPISMAIAPDGRRALIVNNSSNSISDVNLTDNSVISIGNGAPFINAVAVAITPDSKIGWVIVNPNPGVAQLVPIGLTSGSVASCSSYPCVGTPFTIINDKAYNTEPTALSLSIVDQDSNGR